jgi:hypothetical protein
MHRFDAEAWHYPFSQKYAKFVPIKNEVVPLMFLYLFSVSSRIT